LTDDAVRTYFSHMPTKIHRGRWTLTCLAAAGFFIGVNQLASAAENTNATVQIRDLGKALRIEINGEMFSEYHYAEGPRPYLYPIKGPGGVAMSRDWPMKDTPGEEHDHPHHKSLWFTHGDVNGIDFWSDGTNKGTILHASFGKITSSTEKGVVEEQTRWLAPGGKQVLTEDRVMRFYGQGQVRILDFETTLRATHGDLVFGDTKEGSMAIRLAETMRLKGGLNQGHIINSEGVKDGQTWGKRATWCDYYGPAEGRLVGVAIFDHPTNPRHPTWWHVRDYGLFAANPFGVHDFEKKEAGTGNLTVASGKSITFRYRFYFHDGDEKAAHVADYYAEYVRGGLHPKP
jgi:hypothetical protein